MSRETREWLNGGNILVGNIATVGKPWWHDPMLADAHDESLFYDGPIPVGDVSRRLFSWQAESRPLFLPVPVSDDDVPDGVMLHADGTDFAYVMREVEDRQAIVRSDTSHLMGIFKSGYEMHQYNEWLIGYVSNLIQDSVGIRSAGLLRSGAIAWVQIELPENIQSKVGGIEFRPSLLATTSFDGSTATTYKKCFQLTVCDNTREIALSENGAVVKIKHSRYSVPKLASAQAALGLLGSMVDEFNAEVASLLDLKVSPLAWSKFLDLDTPLPADPGKGMTMAYNRRERLNALWNSDPRVAPWNGTAFGVVQTINTFSQHEGIVRKVGKVERNMENAIAGKIGDTDRHALGNLQLALASIS